MREKRTACHGLLIAAMIVAATVPAIPAHAQQLIADDETITEFEIEQRTRLAQIGRHKTPSRAEVIEELRNEKRKIEEARASGIEITEGEVDQVYATMASRMRLTPEQLTQQLARSGVSADTVKNRIRADMASGQFSRRAPRSDVK
jgi:peptidyl-prolyl cis-trans isomerase SurA